MKIKSLLRIGNLYHNIVCPSTVQYFSFKPYIIHARVIIRSTCQNNASTEGFSILDGNYTGWCFKSILEASSRVLSICNVIKNTEQNHTVKLSRDKTTFTTVVEGVTPTANNHLTTKAYTDTAVNAVKSVTDNVQNQSLKNIYNTTLAANKLLCTDNSGYITTTNSVMPHLYLHMWHYDKTDMGEVNFFILTAQSTQMSNQQLINYLKALACNVYYRSYPATGQGPQGETVAGIYINENAAQENNRLLVSTYTSSTQRQWLLSRFSDAKTCSIMQLF